MPSIEEWLAGETVTGEKLDPEKTRIYRLRRNKNAATTGVGTEFELLAKEFKVKKTSLCQCAKLRSEMNSLGIDGCREQKADLLVKLNTNYATLGLIDKLVALLYGGLPPWLSLTAPVESMLDEAIRRAEVKQAGKLHDQAAEDRRLHDGEK